MRKRHPRSPTGQSVLFCPSSPSTSVIPYGHISSISLTYLTYAPSQHRRQILNWRFSAPHQEQRTVVSEKWYVANSPLSTPGLDPPIHYRRTISNQPQHDKRQHTCYVSSFIGKIESLPDHTLPSHLLFLLLPLYLLLTIPKQTAIFNFQSLLLVLLLLICTSTYVHSLFPGPMDRNKDG